MNELDYYRSALFATSELFISMHILDLETGKYSALKTNTHILTSLETMDVDMQETLSTIMGNLAAPESREAILEFTDLSTLQDRLKNQRVVSQIFFGKVHGWCIARFVRMDREEPAHSVLYVVENVDEQTREIWSVTEKK